MKKMSLKKSELERAVATMIANKERVMRIPTEPEISLVLTRNGESIALHYHKTPYNGHGDRVIAFRLYDSWTFYSCTHVKFE